MAMPSAGRTAGFPPTTSGELEDMNRIPAEQGGDTYLVNGNMLPLDQAGKFYTESEGKKP